MPFFIAYLICGLAPCCSFYFTSLFAFCFTLRFYFAFVTILASHFGSHDIVTSLASHFAFGHFITHTHTHTHSLSLSLSLSFSLQPSLPCTVPPLGFTSHTSASHHTSWPHVTHLGLLSRSSAARHASWPLVMLLGRMSHISALHHTSQLLILSLVFILFLF